MSRFVGRALMLLPSGISKTVGPNLNETAHFMRIHDDTAMLAFYERAERQGI